MYDTLEGIAEHAERIVSLEEICQDLYDVYKFLSARQRYVSLGNEQRVRDIEARMRALGMVVER